MRESADAKLFDDYAASYELALRRGIRLSGESREFFSLARVKMLRSILRTLRPEDVVLRILDFGCGTGGTACDLLDAFPCAEVIGMDTSGEMIALARRDRLRPSLRFETLAPLASMGSGFDLVYAANVFHHVEPAQRVPLLRRIRGCLRPGGHLALFENNAWNPGARAVMARIDFDRDAVPLSVLEARRSIQEAGLEALRTRSLFYFPRLLRLFRPLEGLLSRLPLGAQYLVLARSPRTLE